MRTALSILVVITSLTLLSGAAGAGVPTIHANDIFHTEPGETFDVVVLVECHAQEANYTVVVKLHPRFEFVPEGSAMNVSGDSASITYTGYDEDTLRFEFPMMPKDDTPEGEYKTGYSVFWTGPETGNMTSQVTSSSVAVSVGEGTSGSCATLSFVILPILALVSSFAIIRKKGT